MKKESFILYNSFYEPIKALKNEQLGKLLRAIFNYTINGEITQDEEIIIAFMFIKNQLDIDSTKWEEERNKRSEAGRLGGIKRAINQNQVLSSKSKQCLNDLSDGKQTQANQADNVNDNVNVNVNDNVNDIIINNNNAKKFKKPTLEEVENYCKERNNGINAQHFIDFYESKGWKVGNNQMKDWKACVRTWESRNTKTIKSTPDWLGKTIMEQVATNEEIKKLEERMKR